MSNEQAEGLRTDRWRTLNELLFPDATRAFDDVRAQYGDVSVLSTLDYLYGLRPGQEHVAELAEGKRLIMMLQAIGEPDARGLPHRAGHPQRSAPPGPRARPRPRW